jgi:hypothetical protein
VTGLRFASLAAVVLSCSTPVVVETLAAKDERVVRRVALMPLQLASPEVAPERPDAAKVVTARVLEALSSVAGLSVIPPEEVERVVPPRTDAVSAARTLHRLFGVDTVLTGTVRRFVTRIGSEAGANRPASVWFDLELRDPSGEPFWRARYDETQTGLAENLGSFPRAYQRGFRWVTAEELTAYGARELVAKLPRAE